MLKDIGSVITFEDEDAVTHNFMVFKSYRDSRNYTKFNKELYGSPLSLNDYVGNGDDDRVGWGPNDDPNCWWTGFYDQFYCHDENGKRVRILIEYCADFRDVPRRVWMKKVGREWDMINYNEETFNIHWN